MRPRAAAFVSYYVNNSRIPSSAALPAEPGGRTDSS